MKLRDFCEIKFDIEDADFYIIAKGSENQIGKPSIQNNETKNKIGIKVINRELIDPKYLYYLFEHLFQSKFWSENGLVYGSLNLKNLRLEDVRNLKFNNS